MVTPTSLSNAVLSHTGKDRRDYKLQNQPDSSMHLQTKPVDMSTLQSQGVIAVQTLASFNLTSLDTSCMRQ